MQSKISTWKLKLLFAAHLPGNAFAAFDLCLPLFIRLILPSVLLRGSSLSEKDPRKNHNISLTMVIEIMHASRWLSLKTGGRE